MSRKDGRQGARINHQISLVAVDSINVNVNTLLVMGWHPKKIETMACGQDGRRPFGVVAIVRALAPEMEMNKPMLHSEITLLYT